VFENRMEASLSGAALSEGPGKLASLAQPFLDAVAEPTAVPGGGSVSALAGALGASLGQMVAGLSRKKKAQAAHVDQLSDAVAEFHAASKFLSEAVDRDAASFGHVMAAYKLPQETSEQKTTREDTIQLALHGAATVPLEVARKAADAFERLGTLRSISSPSMASDVKVGRLMAAAAVHGALANVEINLESITDQKFATALRTESAALAARVASPVA
jgi:formiminotetrahydrofolate cyclodeaminase